jgi:hypothetical protein
MFFVMIVLQQVGKFACRDAISAFPAEARMKPAFMRRSSSGGAREAQAGKAPV